MSATVMPARSSSASMARDGSSSASRSGRSSQPAPPTPITGAMTRPLTGWRSCSAAGAAASITTTSDRDCRSSHYDRRSRRNDAPCPTGVPRGRAGHHPNLQRRHRGPPRHLRDAPAHRGRHPRAGSTAATPSWSWRPAARKWWRSPRPRPTGRARCYDGIAEFSVYVARSARGQGAGRAAMDALIDAAAAAGLLEARLARLRGERRQPAPAGRGRVPGGRHLPQAREARRSLARRRHRRAPDSGEHRLMLSAIQGLGLRARRLRACSSSPRSTRRSCRSRRSTTC